MTVRNWPSSTHGPTLTPACTPSPTLSARAFSTTSRVNSAATDETTTAREVAVQRWPVEPNAPCAVPVAASSRSASSSTITGFLPPISHCTFFRRAAASA